MMLKDCIEILKEKEKNYKGKNSIEFYTDSYLLDDGIYFLVDLKTLQYEKMVIKQNEFEPIDFDLYNKIKKFDFLSQTITPTKKIINKGMIKTTNCFSVCFQEENLLQISEEIDKYFEKSQNMLKQSDYYSNEFIEFQNCIEKFEDLAKKIIEDNYSDKKIKSKNFIKIFADLPLEKYLLLQKIYYAERLALSEKGSYSSPIRKNYLALNKIPANFISTNSKKPFNANKTRKVPAICYENEEDRTNRCYLSKYLMLSGKTNEFKDRYIQVRNDPNKGFGFEEYEVIPRDIQRIEFYYDNYLCLDWICQNFFIHYHYDERSNPVKQSRQIMRKHWITSSLRSS